MINISMSSSRFHRAALDDNLWLSSSHTTRTGAMPFSTLDCETFTPCSPRFFEREPHTLARALLGQWLVRELPQARLVGRIVEVEVYGGRADPASHADSGKPTARTRAMFGVPGTAYIYRIYGIYDCLNVVAPACPRASAILIRALEPLYGVREMASHRGFKLPQFDEPLPLSQQRNLLSGPGKICQAMAISREFNFHDLSEPPLYIAHTADAKPSGKVVATPRVGINPRTCGRSADWPWRYIWGHSKFLSRKWKGEP